eukprot:TRINITY_DN1010_c1_g3_i1.p1 TRINITY_DN1010_c1_g3~~TRINITY_DN1010_c1_g3_i1.p1  ORF type:complete len:173 (+),score=21.97 TRINITY_DN1010_c1_g3_i1:26-520(+)
MERTNLMRALGSRRQPRTIENQENGDIILNSGESATLRNCSGEISFGEASCGKISLDNCSNLKIIMRSSRVGVDLNQCQEIEIEAMRLPVVEVDRSITISLKLSDAESEWQVISTQSESISLSHGEVMYNFTDSYNCGSERLVSRLDEGNVTVNVACDRYNQPL